MTIKEIYNKGKELLDQSGIEDSSFEVMCLMEKHFHVDRAGLVLSASEVVDSSPTDGFFADIDRRISGTPMQYILGQWEFFGNTFFVGDGVLIPRPETELLVEEAIGYLKSHPTCVVMDLCAGSGCIGITLAKMFPQITCYCLELSEDAASYLNKNIEYHNLSNAISVKYDVLSGKPEQLPEPDMIISNPPYIPTADIPSLQREVLVEPNMALDGGEDGLIFYKAIAKKWLPILKSGGFLAVEFGIYQSKQLFEIFDRAGLKNISVKKDYNGIERVLFGQS